MPFLNVFNKKLKYVVFLWLWKGSICFVILRYKKCQITISLGQKICCLCWDVQFLPLRGRAELGQPWSSQYWSRKFSPRILKFLILIHQGEKIPKSWLRKNKSKLRVSPFIYSGFRVCSYRSQPKFFSDLQPIEAIL